jgi:hypothetical protein
MGTSCTLSGREPIRICFEEDQCLHNGLLEDRDSGPAHGACGKRFVSSSSGRDLCEFGRIPVEWEHTKAAGRKMNRLGG